VAECNGSLPENLGSHCSTDEEARAHVAVWLAKVLFNCLKDFIDHTSLTHNFAAEKGKCSCIGIQKSIAIFLASTDPHSKELLADSGI
jgi:hypothetical protein